MKDKHAKQVKKPTPVTAVPVHAHARGSKYHGAFAIIKIPNAYEVTDIKTDLHAFMSSISNSFI